MRKEHRKMKKSLVDYVKLLCKNNYKILEDILVNKFRKFISLYWLLEKYDEKIKDLQYNESEEDVLLINIKVTKKSLGDILEDLEKRAMDDNITYYQDDKDICIRIVRHEE